MLNYKKFIFLFLILLIVTSVLYWLNLYPQQNNIYKYKFTEIFNNYSNNLILDGNVTNSKLLQNASENVSEVAMHNPGLSSKVVEIKNNYKSKYISKITVKNIESNSTYTLSFWYAFKRGRKFK